MLIFQSGIDEMHLIYTTIVAYATIVV
ncbi:hypothetical protein VCRLGP107_30122 [Vibrio crassostreae]|nr:hypothetical protein VCRLGP107_30122 [Vibrio crassostreae]